MCEAAKISTILITGMPGVGKTTVVKKIYEELKQKSLYVAGFYTEEVRDHTRNRIGFDIVDLEGKRDVLARVNQIDSTTFRRPKVGKYNVYVDKICSFIDPIFRKEPEGFVIDEIGKMELLCKDFETHMYELMKKLDKGEIKLIATIPKATSQKIKIVEDFKNRPDAKLFELTNSNRNKCGLAIIESSLKMFQE